MTLLVKAKASEIYTLYSLLRSPFFSIVLVFFHPLIYNICNYVTENYLCSTESILLKEQP